MLEDPQKGWVRPERRRTDDELRARIAELRAALDRTEGELRDREEAARLETIARIRNIMRAHDLTLVDLDQPAAAPKAPRLRRVRTSPAT